ncbi:TIGR02234 family membrane protein, partial [Streptomyces sp. NPDC048279]|uniref:TIGR02234 family membrane protein n=1 Tax=Streptomyces sp. NPDC048279 TaxID=3154714 RepID=UPI0034268109
MEYVTAAPHPRSEAAAHSGSGRRSLAVALLFGALGAAVALLSTRQRWAEGTATVAGGAFPLTAKGSDVTGVPAALAIVGLAALVAVFAVRRAGRFLVSGLLALCGAGIVLAALAGASDGSALDERAVDVGYFTSDGVEYAIYTASPADDWATT